MMARDLSLPAWGHTWMVLFPYVNAGFAIHNFQELGAPHGLHLNLDKTKKLTTLDPEVPAADPDLLQVLELIKQANCLTCGTTYLGSPSSCHSYVSEQLDSAADAFDVSCIAIQAQLSDHHTQLTLFTKCLQATVPHLLAADVLLWAPGALHPIDPYQWSSLFVSRLNASTASFLAYITGQPITCFNISLLQWFLAHTPVASGGLSLQDFAAQEVASFVIPLAHSIHFVA